MVNYMPRRGRGKSGRQSQREQEAKLRNIIIVYKKPETIIIIIYNWINKWGVHLSNSASICLCKVIATKLFT